MEVGRRGRPARVCAGGDRLGAGAYDVESGFAGVRSIALAELQSPAGTPEFDLAILNCLGKVVWWNGGWSVQQERRGKWRRTAIRRFCPA